MNETRTDTRSLVVERDLAHPPEKVWRALTQSALIEEWLMKNDFLPQVGHKFNFRTEPVAHWSGITHCQVLLLEPPARLSYTWNSSANEAEGLRTVVTWTLTPIPGGTRLRMEQSGFRQEEEANYRGASYGWQRFIGSLERVLAGLP